VRFLRINSTQYWIAGAVFVAIGLIALASGHTGGVALVIFGVIAWGFAVLYRWLAR